ncbi:MAG TPA: helix-turn-helix domain-containing protein [Cyclobacteriaceae bacterium]|jgi:AraC-like DNA-binding protein|nr:helix-turn-helix domain-containing protein [Cyclobacteriaceae bacterium]
MRAINPIPQDRISDYVERILVIENFNVANSFTLPLFANGTPTLLFLTTKATIDNKRTNYLTLFGQTVFPETLTIKDNFTLIAYFLKPFSLFSLFGILAKELTDYPIDLNLLSQLNASELQEKLLNAESTEVMLTLLNDFIFALITKKNAEKEIIKCATAIIATRPSKESLILVQDKLSMTERTFERMFEKNIGISPNLFRRICQFNLAFQQLNARQFSKLSDLAFQNGYADQSHFIRAFKEFTDITPKEYLRFGQRD